MPHSILRVVDKVLLAVSILVAISMSGFVFLSSVVRYVFGTPFGFTEEIVGLLFIIMIFCAFGSVALRNSHIEVDLVKHALGPRARRISTKLSNIITALFFGLLSYLTWDYLSISYDLGARSAESRILLWPWVAMMLVGCIFAFTIAVVEVFRNLSQKDS